MPRAARVLCVLALIAWVQAAHKPLICMRYRFDDTSMLDEDDFEEYASGYLEPTPTDPNGTHRALAMNLAVEEPQPMRCAPDFNFCFTLWTQNANGTRKNISSQGCWKEGTDHNVTCVQTECVAANRNDSLLYCCCSGDLCNQNVSVAKAPQAVFVPPHKSHAAAAAATSSRQQRPIDVGVVIYTVLSSLFAVAFVCAVAYTTVVCMQRREKPEPEAAPLAPSGPGYSSNLRNVDNLKCLDIIGRGKYGVVYKGLIHDQVVAIKNFPEAHRQYYVNEREIYSLPLMDSPALLTYFGFDERPTIEGKPQFLLLLSLAPLGCLQDWLIAHTPAFEVFCGMARSITRGLSHLHTELQRGDLYKPCVAHRDLNTRNVLVNADLSCCIADFGFALKVFGSKYEYKGEVALAETKSINEVGTIRYMAPELLEGAVNLRDCETSLKQMDVYALGLVLWELATRCADFYAPGQATPPYKAPYELEVGAHPSFEQMQVLVARHKARPLFPAGWGGGAAEKLVKDTCEDCWDHDAEARLTSLCAEERMQEVENLRPRALRFAQATSPLLNPNDLGSPGHGHGHGHGHGQAQPLLPANSTRPRTRPSPEAPPSTVSPPPNQQVGGREKNHLMQPQQQLQPYQGRNPCQERNLAPASARPPPVLVERSKKHSFQERGQESSLSCLEDDVSVEELLAGSASKKFGPGGSGSRPGRCMGQGFPKQQNCERKLRGWHGVRALIQQKLFRRDAAGPGANVDGLLCGEEKSNLVDNRRRANASRALTPTKDTTVNLIGDRGRGAPLTTTTTTTTTATTPPEGFAPSRRPNNLNLDLGPPQPEPEPGKSNLRRHLSASEGTPPAPQSSQNRVGTPSRVVPRSLSTSLAKTPPYHNNNNNNNSPPLDEDVFKGRAYNNNHNNNIRAQGPAALAQAQAQAQAHLRARPLGAERHLRRQRSLEVFHEIFSGRGSTEKLRDPSQRVKTPGDVPPSVRKVRASKTLSLYDDRMMDPTTLNIL